MILENLQTLIPSSAQDAQVDQDYYLLREECGLLKPQPLSLIRLEGEDRLEWLQGQSTNDLTSLQEGGSLSFCLCSPTGQIVCVCDLWTLAESFLIVCPTETASAFLDRVAKMVILEDVSATLLDDEYQLHSIQGPGSDEALRRHFNLPDQDGAAIEDIFCLRSNRIGTSGWDLWIPRSDARLSEAICEALRRVHNSAFDIVRLEAGQPVYGRDINEKTLPPEMGSLFEKRHVSYTKGCYTGQEILMRLHSRGHTNKTWMGLIAQGELSVGELVSYGERADAGIITSTAYSPTFGYIAGAMLRNEATTEGTLVRVRTPQGEVEAEVRQMPFLK